jgi:hypothetical protein
MAMLNEGQEIVYTRLDLDAGCDEVVANVTPKGLDNMSRTLGHLLRNVVPFSKPGDPLQVIGDNRTHLLTSPIEKVSVEGNTLYCRTANSKYAIAFKGIDLKRVITDGRNNGVNSTSKEDLPPFPSDQETQLSRMYAYARTIAVSIGRLFG